MWSGIKNDQLRHQILMIFLMDFNLWYLNCFQFSFHILIYVINRDYFVLKFNIFCIYRSWLIGKKELETATRSIQYYSYENCIKISDTCFAYTLYHASSKRKKRECWLLLTLLWSENYLDSIPISSSSAFFLYFLFCT